MAVEFPSRLKENTFKCLQKLFFVFGTRYASFALRALEGNDGHADKLTVLISQLEFDAASGNWKKWKNKVKVFCASKS